MTRKTLARRIAEILFNEPATRRGAGATPTRRACADFGRVLCCSSVKDHSGYSPSYRQSGSDRRAPSQNPLQRCYTSHGCGALACPTQSVAFSWLAAAPRRHRIRPGVWHWATSQFPRTRTVDSAENCSRQRLHGRRYQSPITSHQSPLDAPVASRVPGVNHNWPIQILQP